MSTELTVRDEANKIERVLIGGDLASLKPEERVSFYKMVCESVGLNPLTKPLEYIQLNGKLTLYARKDATDQLRNIHSVSISIVAREVVEGCYVVTSRAKLPSGREDESIGAVPIENLKGEARANALMKCETKSKRRVTLSICGLGMLDESEIETIPSAKVSSEQVAGATAEARTFTKPNSAGSDNGQGDVSSNGTAKPEPAKTADTPSAKPVKASTAADATSPIPIPDKLAEQKELPGCIYKGEAVNFARNFKDALRKDLKKLATELEHEYLKSQGILDPSGNPTAYAIRKEHFFDVREAAMAYAKEL